MILKDGLACLEKKITWRCFAYTGTFSLSGTNTASLIRAFTAPYFYTQEYDRSIVNKRQQVRCAVAATFSLQSHVPTTAVNSWFSSTVGSGCTGCGSKQYLFYPGSSIEQKNWSSSIDQFYPYGTCCHSNKTIS